MLQLISKSHVVLEAAWLVRDVKTADDAIGVAISEAGKRLNPKLDFVEVDVGTTSCPVCGEPFSSVFIAANTALVGLIFEMKVFDAESAEHGLGGRQETGSEPCCRDKCFFDGQEGHSKKSLK